MDVVAAAEFGRIVVVDAIVGAEFLHERHDLGAKLEPDEWEEEHEP